MPKYSSSFLGPSAPWLLDDEEDMDSVAYRQMLRDSADALATNLEHRAQVLRHEEVDLDMVMREIRCQATEAGAAGQLGVMRELAEFALELLMAKENARRAV